MWHLPRRPSLIGLTLLAVTVVTGACDRRTHVEQHASLSPSPVVWTVGAHGAILASSDGRHWPKQQSGTTKDLNGVAFADERDGWVVGDDGVVLHTDDGGSTWQRQKAATGQSLRGIACSDALHAWIVGGRTSASGIGGRGIILATTDGGKTWMQQRRLRGACLVAVACADATLAWAVGGESVFATSDGGAHWHLQWAPSRGARGLAFPAGLWAVGCGDASRVWAVGSGWNALNGMLVGEAPLWTRDGGGSWAMNKASRGQNVFCLGRDYVWLLDVNEVMASTDGGVTWHSHFVGKHSGPFPVGGCYLVDCAFGDPVRGWTVGRKLVRPRWMRGRAMVPTAPALGPGLIFETTDGGATWTRQALVKGFHPAAVSCAPSGSASP